MAATTFLRRPTDTTTFTILYWLFLSISVVGLTFFALDRLVLVLRRDFVLESKMIYSEKVQDVPDVIFCMKNATLVELPVYLDYIKVPLTGPNVPHGYHVSSPCEDKYYNMMYVFWAKNAIHISKASDMEAWIVFNTERKDITRFVLLPAETNPYRRRTLIPNSEGRRKMDIMEPINSHYANNTGYAIQINAIPRRTRVLRSDFWGLFNVYNTTAEHSLTSSFEMAKISESSEFVLNLPLYRIEDREVLIVSLPDALSAWGGVCTLVFGAFFLLFGSARLSPFGVVQRYFMRSSTKANIAKVYGYSKRDSSDFYGSDNGSGFRSLPNQSRESCVLGAPSSGYISPSNGYLSPSLVPLNSVPYKYHLELDMYTAGSEDVSELREQDQQELRQQQQEQNQKVLEELAFLRSMVQSHDNAFHLQDKRCRQMESLLNDLFLNMDFMEDEGEEKLWDRRTSQETVVHINDPDSFTDSVSGWLQRLAGREGEAAR